mmetsp:Transcript_18827/g.24315  ORF Transcript_18827/g.24315 Transcript_18827/m.24315 type:complete len:287 (-) Transcript_18827:396-1256(-)
MKGNNICVGAFVLLCIFCDIGAFVLPGSGKLSSQKCSGLPSRAQSFRSTLQMSEDSDYDESAPSDTATDSEDYTDIDVEASPSTSEDLKNLKQEFLLACLGVNRGFSATSEEKETIAQLVELLESENPNPTPCAGLAEGKSPLTGEWRLVYTTALDVLSVGLVPVISVGQVYQNINEDGSEITNIIDLQPNAAPLLNSIGGSTVARLRVEAEGSVDSDTRISIKFKSSAFEPKSFLGQEVAGVLPTPKVNFPSMANPIGYIENTFVDETLRICRAIGDNVFVLTRV